MQENPACKWTHRNKGIWQEGEVGDKYTDTMKRRLEIKEKERRKER